MVDGGLCERLVLRADKLHPCQQLSFEQLALVETLAIGCHAASRGGACPADHALIIGAGPIGLATLEFTRLAGSTITVMDLSAARLEFCRRTYGIDRTILVRGDATEVAEMRSITSGDMYEVVTDATGHSGSMGAAVDYVAQGGVLVYVGITPEEIKISHPPMHRRELTIRGSRNALPADFQRILKLIETGQINTDPWITHRTSLDRVIDDFESYTRPETGVIKAMIEVS
jgi:alcohol dehydrogenase